MKGSRVLITGGGGFIGTHLAESLCHDNDVVLFDNFRRDSLQYIPALRAHPRIRVVHGNVLDCESVRDAMEGVDTVIHSAAIAGVSNYYNESKTTLQVNILGTVNVLDAFVAVKAKRLLYFSTSEVYGSEAGGVDEEMNHGIGPVSDRRWVYAVSKLAGENFVLRYGEEHGFHAVCVRPFNIYGPRQTGEGAISNFALSLAAGKPLTVYGDGADIRSWCYISDLVTVVPKLLLTPETAGMTFNIGNPNTAVTSLELAEIAIKVHGGGSIIRAESGHAPIRNRYPNIDRARKYVGFEPMTGLEDGLSKTFAWFQETMTP